MAESGRRQRYVVVGGGVAGVSCAEELARLSPESHITVLSDSALIKAATNISQQSRVLEAFDVEEKKGSYLEQMYGNVTVLSAHVNTLRPEEKVVECSSGRRVPYDKLCLCTGAKPRLIVKDHDRVLGIRDTESVEDFQKKLQRARRIVVVGNGGIATEYEVKECEVVWAIRHSSICHTFVDEGAAVFFLPHLSHKPPDGGEDAGPVKRTKYVYERLGMGEWKRGEVGVGGGGDDERGEWGEGQVGSALGPDWQRGRQLRGHSEVPSHVHVEYECELAEILTADQVASRGLQPSDIDPSEPHQGPNIPPEPQPSGDKWAVYVLLTNGRVFGCDLVVSATGAYPNTSSLMMPSGHVELSLSDEGGVVIDNEMRSNLTDVYAAGDVCTVNWAHSQLWFQMRLWTQARQMGVYAARAMVAHSRKENVSLDFCFEMFAHVTKFFGYKVVLLGLFNAQGLPTSEYEVLLRCTKGEVMSSHDLTMESCDCICRRGEEYVKAVLKDGRMVGALLIGETDLEETFENLILNQMDLSELKDHLLDPRVDIEDFFD